MEFRPNILVIDDEKVVLDSVSRILKKDDYPFELVDNATDGLKLIGQKHFDVVLLDLALPDIPGQKVLVKILKESPDTHVVIITGHATIDNAVQTLTLGASDFLAKPFSANELRGVMLKLTRKLKLVMENELLRRTIAGHGEKLIIIGRSKPMREVISLVEKVAPTDSTVLITGESGTGKEIIARAIHEKSLRKEKAFVPIDCTSLVETLLESELFGHVRGSFTGAVETKHGYFELAHGGTMFFDEVGNLPLNIQAKLLRVLQSRIFTPVGQTTAMQADVRILAATNRDLADLIQQGKFREDLYYRLNVVPMRLPPVRKRREDVLLLVDYFVDRFNRRRTMPIVSVGPEAQGALMAYSWPGNVREIENTIERAMILEESDVLTVESLPIQLTEKSKGRGPARFPTLEQMEKEHILKALSLAGQNRSKAARILDVDRKTLYNKIKKYGL